MALAIFASKMGHQCVHLVYSEGLYGELGANDLRKQLQKLGICIATDQIAPTSASTEAAVQFSTIVGKITEKSDVKSVICFCEDTTDVELMKAIRMAGNPQLQMLVSDYWGAIDLEAEGIADVAENVIHSAPGVPQGSGQLTNLTYFNEMLRDQTKQDPWFQEVIGYINDCSFWGSGGKASCDIANLPDLTRENLPESPYLAALEPTVKAVSKAIEQFVLMNCDNKNDVSGCLTEINKGDKAGDLYALVLQQQDANGNNLFDSNGDGQAKFVSFLFFSFFLLLHLYLLSATTFCGTTVQMKAMAMLKLLFGEAKKDSKRLTLLQESPNCLQPALVVK